MSKEIPDIIRVADVVRRVLHKMASDGKIEAAAVVVKNLSWTVDTLGREGWTLTLENVEPSTAKKLTLGVIFELELIGLGFDDWDIYTEFPDEDGTRVPIA